MKNQKIQSLLDQAWAHYDPNNDIPPNVKVSFTDSCLLEICEQQQEYIEALESELNSLKLGLKAILDNHAT